MVCFSHVISMHVLSLQKMHVHELGMICRSNVLLVVAIDTHKIVVTYYMFYSIVLLKSNDN